MTTARLALLLVSALWGTTFVLVKSGLADASPLRFLALRFTVAAVASLPLLSGRRFDRGALVRGVPLGLVLAVAYAAQTIGLQTTSPARSAFLTALNVALVPVGAALLLRHRPTLRALGGLVVTLAGVTLLTSPEAGKANSGDLWTIGCAVFFALHVVLLSRWGAGRSAEMLLVSQLAVTSIAAWAASPLETAAFTPTARLAVAVLATAVLATVGTTWLQLRFQPRVDPTEVAILYATEPAFAALFSWLMLAERPTPAALLGGLLIVGGALAAATSRPRGAPPPKEPDAGDAAGR